jgi:hypothetical protein
MPATPVSLVSATTIEATICALAQAKVCKATVSETILLTIMLQRMVTFLGMLQTFPLLV